MSLPNLLHLRKSSEVARESFYALELADEVVKAAIWVIEQGQVQVLANSDSIAIEGTGNEAILAAADMACSSITQDNSEPSGAVFGLPEHWVGEQGIKPSKKEILKFLCTKLELKPLGYVVILEALVAYLRAQQGTPPTALFIRFEPSQLLVSLVQLGKIMHQERVGRSEDLIADVKESLMRFRNVEQFPARMILYNSHLDFEDIKQQLLGFNWEEELPFLHSPRIDALSWETTIEAIAVSGGREAAKALGFELNELEVVETEAVAKGESEQDVDSEVSATPVTSVLAPAPAFVVGQDVALAVSPSAAVIAAASLDEPEPDLESEAETDAEADPPPTRRLPLLSWPDVTKRWKLSLPSRPAKAIDDVSLEEPEPEVTAVSEPAVKRPAHLSSRKPIPRWLYGAGALLFVIVLGAGAVWWYWNVPKAEVVVFVRPNALDTQVDLTLALPEAKTETPTVLPIQETTLTVEGTETIPTTGSKKIGEKAKGSLTILNKTDKPKSFKSGTVLVGPKSLRYVLSADVTVASRSAQTSSDDAVTYTFGKAEATVEAGDIGEDYNQSVEAKMGFKDFDNDQYTAKVSKAISGGSSSSLQVVSKTDRTNALEAVTKKLTAQAKQQLEQQTGGQTLVFDESIETDVSKSEFDHEVDAEANALTVSAAVEISAWTVRKEAFDQFLLQQLKNQIPANFVLSQAGLQTQLSDFKASKDQATTTVDVKAKLIPTLDFAQVKQNVVGRKPQVVEEYFKSLPNFSRVRITVLPALPGALGTLPRKTENITVTLEEAQ